MDKMTDEQKQKTIELAEKLGLKVSFIDGEGMDFEKFFPELNERE